MLRCFLAFALSLGCCSGCGNWCTLRCHSLTDCDSAAPNDNPTFEEALAAWQALPVDPAGFDFMIAAECPNGRQLLLRGDGFTSVGYAFDADDGRFLGMRDSWDLAAPPCWGTMYWPRKVHCPDPVVTEVFHGSWFSVGDAAFW